MTMTIGWILRLDRDVRLLFLTRAVRLFAYGFISVVLVLYLKTLGLGNQDIAILLSLTLIGDTIISLYITTKANRFGLHHSKNTVLKFSALVSLDAFGGGFIVQSIMAYWFFVKFHTQPGTLGSIFFFANILAGVSALLAVRLANKIGLVKTMVYTHLPSNLLLILIPFMPNFTSALAVLMLRFSISQMDVPTRQAYVIAVVHPDERSAASGITGVARTIGSSLALLFSGALLADVDSLGWIFIIAGTVKIVYDLLMFYNFTKVPPLEQDVK